MIPKSIFVVKDGSFIAQAEGELEIELYKPTTVQKGKRRKREENTRRLLMGIGRRPAKVEPWIKQEDN